MPDLISNAIIDDAVARALELSLCFLDGPGRTRHVPFTFSPCTVSAQQLAVMDSVAPLLGRLTQALAADAELIQQTHAALAGGDPFFAEMLSTHRQLHAREGELLRRPLLLQRSDFMLDATLGPRLVECNSIAAGMAPFGERVGLLHGYLEQRFPGEYARFHSDSPGALLTNPASSHMARAIAAAAEQVAAELDDDGPLQFLMVVQENEDNLFDQRLLENALRALGVHTHRRSFRQLHSQLATGPNQCLQLEACGNLHVVYLRAGYQFRDYVATDLDTRRCCDALQETRMFIERHRVAMNATVAQQLATSKRMQLQLATDGGELLHKLGFDRDECKLLETSFARMQQVDGDSVARLRAAGDSAAWVLKNQGEGGGHCLFDDDILPTLEQLGPKDFGAWTLMQRLRPAGREKTTLVVRDGRARAVERLVSEIGVFSAHLDDAPLDTGHERHGHIGYLVRSKPPQVAEGGVHSGYGALDSLFVEN